MEQQCISSDYHFTGTKARDTRPPVNTASSEVVFFAKKTRWTAEQTTGRARADHLDQQGPPSLSMIVCPNIIRSVSMDSEEVYKILVIS